MSSSDEPAHSDVIEPSKEEEKETSSYVKATISADQGGTHAGEVVEILADDYAAKGDEELIEVKLGDDIIFIEKKFIKLGNSVLDKATDKMIGEEEFSFDLEDDVNYEEENGDDKEVKIEDLDSLDTEEITIEAPEVPEAPEEVTDLDKLRAKMKKSVEELESLRSEMKSTFTSTDTISLTIQNLRGMLDALKKDSLDIK